MVNMTRGLRPGGVAVHTTEFNVSSNRRTLRWGHDVLFRRRDLDALKGVLESCGHQVAPFDLQSGNQPEDLYVDEPPYTMQPHLKLRIKRFVSTSVGIIVTVGQSCPLTPFQRELRLFVEALRRCA
jgi:hypothetical protein